MDHITNNTSLIGPSDVIPVGAQNPRFPVVGHRNYLNYLNVIHVIIIFNFTHQLFTD